MKKSLLMISLALMLALPGCVPAAAEARLTVVCTTYPIYLFTNFITGGVEGIAVERLDTGSTSCLHDYTLSMSDMKKLERADVIAVNGAGLEDFLEDALAVSDAVIIDCSEGVELLENLSHDHDSHDHDSHDHGHWDPHYWMDPLRALQMVENLGAGLSAIDQEHQEEYGKMVRTAVEVFEEQNKTLCNLFAEAEDISGLITFHDGFQYFANAFDLPLMASIEEEAGSEASAHEIVEITELVNEFGIPVIFTETNGSKATANAISRETGCRVAQLTMIMDGADGSLWENYLAGLERNALTIIEGFKGGDSTP